MSCINCIRPYSFSDSFNLSNKRSSKFSFTKPKESTYIIITNEDETRKVGSCYRLVTFKHLLYDNNIFPWIDVECYSILKPNTKNRLILLRVINKKVDFEDKKTIVFSHGYSSDLGTQYAFLIDMATQTKVNLNNFKIIFDYR